MNARHILITGERGAGKSTLIERLVSSTDRPVYGFVTKRLEADPTGFHPIYIHPAMQRVDERTYSDANLIGVCDAKTHRVTLDVFNTLGVRYIEDALPGGIIVMDELGFMESEASRFTQAVLGALCGDIPVIAAVKARFDVPFLDAVRAHNGCRTFLITPGNREEVFREADSLLRDILYKAKHD